MGQPLLSSHIKTKQKKTTKNEAQPPAPSYIALDAGDFFKMQIPRQQQVKAALESVSEHRPRMAPMQNGLGPRECRPGSMNRPCAGRWDRCLLVPQLPPFSSVTLDKSRCLDGLGPLDPHNPCLLSPTPASGSQESGLVSSHAVWFRSGEHQSF